MSYTITLIKIVSTLAAVSCGAIGSYWIYDGVQESKATIGMSANCTVRGVSDEHLLVTWDVAVKTRHGDEHSGVITSKAGSKHEVDRLENRYRIGNSYPCLFPNSDEKRKVSGEEMFLEESSNGGNDMEANLVWESLDGAWHMSVGIFMVLLFLVWLLSLPSWVPSCRRYCCACCVRTPDDLDYYEGMKPTLRLSVALFISDLSGRLRRLSRLESTADNSAICAICLEGYDGEMATALDCLHHFHKDCLSEWLQHKFQCPICNQDPSNARNFRSARKLLAVPSTFSSTPRHHTGVGVLGGDGGARLISSHRSSSVTELSQTVSDNNKNKTSPGVTVETSDLNVQTPAGGSTPYMVLDGKTRDYV